MLLLHPKPSKTRLAKISQRLKLTPHETGSATKSRARAVRGKNSESWAACPLGAKLYPPSLHKPSDASSHEMKIAKDAFPHNATAVAGIAGVAALNNRQLGHSNEFGVQRAEKRDPTRAKLERA
jgi:hypothetical protein